MNAAVIVAIKDAIIRQEGMPADHRNPGNLRDCPWFPGQAPLTRQSAYSTVPPFVISRRHYPDGSLVEYTYDRETGIFWDPPNRLEGEAGIMHCLWLRTVERQSLRAALSAWAPAGDGKNNPSAYVANVANWTDIVDPDAPLLELLGNPFIPAAAT